MSTQPDRINPQSPPETPAQPIFDPPSQPDEAVPLPPDTDHPGRGPDEIPNPSVSHPAAAKKPLAAAPLGQARR